MGILVLVHSSKKFKFSWKRLVGLGFIGAFNKGMTGGGYGPVLASGQIISGVKSKKAVGITAIVESLISVVGVAVYLLGRNYGYIDVSLLVSLIIGGLISTPLAVLFVKKIKTSLLKKFVGIASIVAGVFVFLKVFI